MVEETKILSIAIASCNIQYMIKQRAMQDLLNHKTLKLGYQPRHPNARGSRKTTNVSSCMSRANINSRGILKLELACTAQCANVTTLNARPARVSVKAQPRGNENLPEGKYTSAQRNPGLEWLIKRLIQTQNLTIVSSSARRKGRNSREP